MVKTEAFEFPFVEQLPKLSDLPKREKSRMQRIWDDFRALSKIAEEKGMLCPVALAAKILDVSRQRAYDLIGEGRLEVVEVNGHQFVTEKSVIDYALSERKAGRPSKTVQLAEEKGPARAAFRVAREFLKSK